MGSMKSKKIIALAKARLVFLLLFVLAEMGGGEKAVIINESNERIHQPTSSTDGILS
jgi:hypothetical protein